MSKVVDCIWAILLIVISGIVASIASPDRAIVFMVWMLNVIFLYVFIHIRTSFSLKGEVDISHNINIVKLKENATIPTRGSDEAAGYDLYACIDESLTINPHETVMVPTGLSIELPRNTYSAIHARSGLASKKGLRPANCVGVCDSDYRGEYMVALHNDRDEVAIIEPNERIAQMIVKRYEKVNFKLVEKLSNTKRGSGGFGSTGK